MKDQLGDKVETQFDSRPDFERLEHEGQKLLGEQTMKLIAVLKDLARGRERPGQGRQE